MGQSLYRPACGPKWKVSFTSSVTRCQRSRLTHAREGPLNVALPTDDWECDREFSRVGAPTVARQFVGRASHGFVSVTSRLVGRSA